MPPIIVQKSSSSTSFHHSSKYQAIIVSVHFDFYIVPHQGRIPSVMWPLMMPGLNSHTEHESWQTASSPFEAVVYSISAEDPPTSSTQDSHRVYPTIDTSSLQPVEYEQDLARSHTCDGQSDYVDTSGLSSTECSELPEYHACKRAPTSWYCCT